MRCHAGATDEPVQFDGVIDAPSGIVSIGDANAQHAVQVPTKRCRVQITATSWLAAKQIDVWLTPVDG